MLIRDLERKTGLDRATIRFYEREGLIAPERSENGYRTYSLENHTIRFFKLSYAELYAALDSHVM